MSFVDETDVRLLAGSGGSGAPVIYAIDLPEHPFPWDEAARGLSANVVVVPVPCWDDALTPWPAAGLRAGQRFGGRADKTLEELQGAAPRMERRLGLAPSARAICGYSLGGLFSLYAFARDACLSASGCVSGSVWYPGWVAWLRDGSAGCACGRDAAGGAARERFAYLSVGSKEKRGPVAFREVESDMEACADILRERGCEALFEVGPGNHMQHHKKRLARALAAIDGSFRR